MLLWKKLPAEFFLLILPSIFGLIISLFIGWEFFLKNIPNLSDYLLKNLAVGMIFLFPIILVILWYIFFKIVLFVTKSILDRSRSLVEQAKIIKLIKSSFFFLALVWSVITPFVLMLSYFSSNSPIDSIIKYSRQFMTWDLAVFSVYPGFWLNNLWSGSLFEKITVTVYGELIIFLLFLFVFFLLNNKEIFRRFLISILFVAIISQPFWYLFPAVSPGWIYERNSYNLSAEKLQLTQKIPEYKISSYLKGKIDFWEKFWLGEKKDKFAVTNNPSMHMAWGVIAVYYFSMFWRPLIFLLIPLGILNGLGAVYTFEHYGIDIIFGFLLALVTLVTVEWFMRREKRLNIDTEWLYYFVTLLQEDLKKLLDFYKKTFVKMFGDLKKLVGR